MTIVLYPEDRLRLISDVKLSDFPALDNIKKYISKNDIIIYKKGTETTVLKSVEI